MSRFLRRGSSGLAVVGICLGVYAVFAVGFHWFVEPSIAKAPPATVLPYSDAAVAAATPSAPPPDIAPKPRRSLAIEDWTDTRVIGDTLAADVTASPLRVLKEARPVVRPFEPSFRLVLT